MMRARGLLHTDISTRFFCDLFLKKSEYICNQIHYSFNHYTGISIIFYKLRRSASLFRLRIECEKYANIIGESMIWTVSMYHSGVCLLYTTGVDKNNNNNNSNSHKVYTQHTQSPFQTNTQKWYFTREEPFFSILKIRTSNS